MTTTATASRTIEPCAGREHARVVRGPARELLGGTATSPARELQQRLDEAVLRGFYAPTVTSRAVNWRRLAAILAIGTSSWALVFLAGGAAFR